MNLTLNPSLTLPGFFHSDLENIMRYFNILSSEQMFFKEHSYLHQVSLPQMLFLFQVNNQSGANNTVDNQGNNTCEKAGFVLEKVRANPWTPGQPRRKRIKDRPNYPFNVWGVMKNCIGKDLSKIPMPVSVLTFSLYSNLFCTVKVVV